MIKTAITTKSHSINAIHGEILAGSSYYESTRGIFRSKYAQEGTQAEDVERILRELGGYNDCEVGLNLCSRLSELGAMADMEDE